MRDGLEEVAQWLRDQDLVIVQPSSVPGTAATGVSTLDPFGVVPFVALPPRSTKTRRAPLPPHLRLPDDPRWHQPPVLNDPWEPRPPEPIKLTWTWGYYITKYDPDAYMVEARPDLTFRYDLAPMPRPPVPLPWTERVRRAFAALPRPTGPATRVQLLDRFQVAELLRKAPEVPQNDPQHPESDRHPVQTKQPMPLVDHPMKLRPPLLTDPEPDLAAPPPTCNPAKNIAVDRSLLAYLYTRCVGENRNQELLRRLREDAIGWIRVNRKHWDDEARFAHMSAALRAVMTPHPTELEQREAWLDKQSRKTRAQVNDIARGRLGPEDTWANLFRRVFGLEQTTFQLSEF